MASLHIDKATQFHTDAGDPLNGGLIYFYITTTTTARNTYPTEADAIAATNANVNPIVLDSDGRAPVEVWISGRYRRIVKTSAGVTIADDDPIEDTVAASTAQQQAQGWGGNNSGTANALVFTYTPAITAYVAGTPLRGCITADNSAAVTVNAGAGVKSLVKRDGAALVAGDLQGPEIIQFAYDSTTDVMRLLSPSQIHSIRSDIASAGTVSLTGYNYARITGTTTITAITLPDGAACDVVFGGALTMTNGASLILPGGANITTAAGDTMRVIGEASSVVRVVSYVRAASGSDGLLSTTTASAAATADIVLPAGYRNYEVVYDTAVSVNNAVLYARVSTDGGSTYKAGASDYYWGRNVILGGGAPSNTAQGDAADDAIELYNGIENGSDESAAGSVFIHNPASTAIKKIIRFESAMFSATPNMHSILGVGAYITGNDAINAIRFLPDSGTITGTFKLYGFA